MLDCYIGFEKQVSLFVAKDSITVEPLFNELLGITNNIFRSGKSYSKMYGTEPLFNKPISAAQT